MDYAGDDGKAIHKNLAEQLDIVGGAADKASEYNIYTYNDGDKLRINLASASTWPRTSKALTA